MQSAEVIACSKHITLHMLQSRQPINLYSPHKGAVNCVHINHTNKVIASCGQDGRIILVNAQKPDNQVFETSFHSGTTVTKPVSVNCIMFSTHSHYIAAGSSDCLIKLWDMKNHKHVHSTIKSHVGSVTSLAWIKNLGIQKVQGQIIASSSSIGDIFLHSVKTSNIVQTLNTKNQQPINQIKVSESQGHCRLAACTSMGSVMIWNLKNIEKDTNPLCSFNNGKKSSITSVSFSSFNPVLLATSSLDQTLTFYDVNQKKSVKVITSQQPLTSINFHGDGHTLLAGGMNGSLFVYDLRKPSKPREKLTGHDSAIKHTFLIKQYEPSSVTMAESRASKSSSVNSFNSSKIPSNKSVKQFDQVKQVKLTNNYVEPNRRIEPVSSNLRPQSRNKQKAEQIEGKKQSIKLSATGQQAIKNSQVKSGFVKPNPSGTVPSGYNYYNNKPADSSVGSYSKNSQVSIPKNINSQVDRSNVVSFTYQQPKTTSNLQSMNESNFSQVRDFMEQKFQTLHMELIQQFHLQKKQMKEMICSLLVEDKKKSQRINELQNQIRQLRGSTY